MNKPTKVNNVAHNIHPLLQQRWSPYAFADQPIKTETLQRLFEAARWAPSSSNLQPWRFFVGQKGDSTHDKIFQSLMEGNQPWAENAPLLLLIVGKIHRKEDKKNRHYQYDCGQAAAHLTFQAMAEGLYVHQMGGFKPDVARDLFDIPEEYDPLTVMAVGYLGELEQLPEKYQERELAENSRQSLAEMVFSETWAQNTTLLD